MANLISDKTAARLMEVLRRVEARANGTIFNKTPETRNLTNKAYIVQTEYDLAPLRQQTKDTPWQVTEGTAIVQSLQPSVQPSLLPENPVTSKALMFSPSKKGSLRECFRVRVWNLTYKTVPACTPVLAMQDTNGDLLIIEDATASPAGTSTTTTQLTTTTGSPCAHRCRFNMVAGIWEEVYNQCSTTSSTAAPTTSTQAAITDDLCRCKKKPTSTTSTTDAPLTVCRCMFPIFCGTNGDCTYTYCTDKVVVPQVACTSTSTAGPTTTCNCNTTTTTPDPGCGYCDYANINGTVQQTYYGCQPDCTCPLSVVIATDCTSASQGCVKVTTTTRQPPEDYCRGSCIYYSVPGFAGWILNENRCVGSETCQCGYPSEPVTDLGDCTVVAVPCEGLSRVTTTSTTTTYPPGGCPGCYTTTSTTLVPTTTTTINPCRKYCRWKNSSGTWVADIRGDTCPSSCPCRKPAYTPTDECEVAETPCGSQPTSTTTSTTTTTCQPFYYCIGSGGSCASPSCQSINWCGPGNPSQYCGGPFTNSTDCASNCPTTTTTPGCDQFKWFCTGSCNGECTSHRYCNPGDYSGCSGPYNSQALCLAACTTTTAAACASGTCKWIGTGIALPGWVLLTPCGAPCTCNMPAGSGGSATTTFMPCHV